MNASVCDKALLKTNLITEALTERFSLTFGKGERETDEEQEALQQVLLINTNTIQLTAGTPAGCNTIFNNFKPKVGMELFALFQPFFYSKQNNYLHMKRTLTLLSLIACLMQGIHAQQSKSVELNELEVSAARTKIYSNLGRILKVVEKVEIEQAAVRSIDDLLDYVAGVDVRQRGVNGVQADVSIRGGSFDQLLILLNGVNITDPQTGHYNLDIPVDISDVSRVEILEGSAARILGPNAFSGAINIITDESNQTKVSSQTTAGSYGYLSNNIAANYSGDKLQVFGTVSQKRSDGYIDNTDFNIVNSFIQSKLTTEHTGNFELQLAYQQKSFGANSFYSLTYPNQYEHTKTFLSALNWDYQHRNWTLNAQAYWRQHHDRFELFRNYEGAEKYSWYKGHNYHLTDVAGGKFIASNTWKAGKTTLGIDLRNEHIFSTVLGLNLDNPKKAAFEDNIQYTKGANRLLTTAFLDHSINFDRWFASAGLAVTQNKEFGTHANGGVDLAYRPTNYSRMFLAANSAVRLPTFTDLYYQSATQISNPNLKPEKSTTFELGTIINPRRYTLTATVYYRNGKNIIDWVKQPDATKWESRNLTEVNAYGMDMGFEYRFENSFVKSTGVKYAYLTLDKAASGYDSKYALDYLKHKLIVNLNHAIWSKLSANWSYALYDRSGTYTDSKSNAAMEYTPYGLLNTKLTWNADKILLFAEVNNLLNEQYIEFGGIAQPGIHINLGLRLSIF